MITRNSKHLFIHVPKCAGMSISNICQKNGIYIDPINRSNSWIRERESFANKEDFDYKYSFAFVRNPFDRMVSAWKCPWVSAKTRYDESEYKTFKHFILDFLPEDSKKNYFRWSHVMPFTDVRMKLFNKNLDQSISFIGRFENLQQDFNIVCDSIGIPHQTLPRKNKSKHKHYTEYYDNETRQTVEKKYAKDIEYFGYEFGK